MVEFDFKAKAKAAQDSLSHQYQNSKGPSTYSPTRYDPNAPTPPTIESRRMNSSVLVAQKEKEWERPIAPPRRFNALESPPLTTSSGTSIKAAPIKSGKPEFLRGESNSTILNLSRNSSFTTTAPPTIHSAARPTPPASRVFPKLPPTVNKLESKFKPFSQFDVQDKLEFFNLLDEVFLSKPETSSIPIPSNIPQIPTTARPTYTEPTAPPPNSQRSYPPLQPHSSSALTLLHYILYEPFPTPWYQSTIPPPLQGRNDIKLVSSSSSRGTEMNSNGMVIFGDASILWWWISWNSIGNSLPKRMGRYRGIPEPWEGEELYSSSQKYGALISNWAIQAVENQHPVGRGECWDIANSGLEFINSQSNEELFPSIGRTHGHLIYFSKIGGESEWSGGDEYVREGDIVEWREIKIAEVGAGIGSYSLLGSPDHTAIIIEASPPHSLPIQGQHYLPRELNAFKVVEQSQGVLPSIHSYDLTRMTKGEIWIYRPVALKEFCGSLLNPRWPDEGVGMEI